MKITFASLGFLGAFLATVRAFPTDSGVVYEGHSGQGLKDAVRGHQVSQRLPEVGVVSEGFGDERLISRKDFTAASVEGVRVDSKITPASAAHKLNPRSVAAASYPNARDSSNLQGKPNTDPRPEYSFFPRSEHGDDRRSGFYTLEQGADASAGFDRGSFEPSNFFLPARRGESNGAVHEPHFAKRPNTEDNGVERNRWDFPRRNPDIGFGLPGRPVKKVLDVILDTFVPNRRPTSPNGNRQPIVHFPGNLFNNSARRPMSDGDNRNGGLRGLDFHTVAQLGPLSMKFGVGRQ